MHSMRQFQYACLLLSALFFISGCRADAVPTVASVAATPQRPATITPAEELQTPLSREQVSATTTVTATTTQTPTPLPPAVLAVPASWQARAIEAAERESDRRWNVLTSDNPASLLVEGAAQLALVPVNEGTVVSEQPLALVVPFAVERDSITLAQAQEILTSGHPSITVIPWQDLQPQQRALYVDGKHVTDAGYPLQEVWSLVAAAGYAGAAETFAANLREQEVERETVHLSAVGDVMLDRTLGTAIRGGDLAYPFAGVTSNLQAADLTVANLECALGDVGEPAAKSYTFRAPPDAAAALAQAGVDVVSLANNHALDFGPSALLQGIELLRAEELAVIGAGENVNEAHSAEFVTIKGLTLAFLGYVNVPVEGRPPYFDTQTWTATSEMPGLAWADPAEIQADVIAVKGQADHVVVVLHSGYEYLAAPSPEQRAAAYAAIDAGATLVIGHHAHILQGVEFYDDGVIVYGLGNFAFTITGPPETAILNAWLDEDGVRQLEFIPAIVQSTGQPRLATESEAAAIRRRIYALSANLN